MQRCIRLLVFLLPLGPRLASGQQVEGRVMEVGTDAPITSAVVTALDADSTIVALALSDSTGRFILTVPEEVTARIRVERLGYTTVETVRLQLGQLDRIPLEVRLRPSPIELDGITAVARMQLNRNVRGFLRRQEHGFGRYAGPSEIARIRPVRSTDVLLPLSPRLVPDGDAGVKARTFPSIGGSTYCNPRVYVDRHLINDLDSEGEPAPPQVDFHVASQSIRAVEVYENPHQAPPYFQEPFMEDCPVIVIWTDYGFGLGEWSGTEWGDEHDGG